MLLFFHFCLTEQQVYLKFIEFKAETYSLIKKIFKNQQNKYNMIWGKISNMKKAVGYMKLDKNIPYTGR